MISFSSFFLLLRCKFLASFVYFLVSLPADGKPFYNLEVSFSHGKSFISENKIASGKPAEISKNYRLLFPFPYAVLVSNDSYLELVNKDEIQLRVGQSSVLEFISPTHLNAMQGTFLLYSKSHQNWKISSNEATISLKGRATWMIEKTLPDADVISFDINLSFRNYISEDVTYIKNDVSNMDWDSFFIDFPEKSLDNTLLFLDDHIDFSSRLDFLEKVNMKYVIYEDNYPPQQGDCISPKQILESSLIEDNVKQKFSSLVKECFEFPPIWLPEKTRWGDSFDNYNVKKPIFSDKPDFLENINSFDNYTYICCMEMNYAEVE